MRWPWRRSREARVVFIGGSPFDVPPVTPPAQPAPPEPPAPHVSLGFADGSTMELADDDPRAIALREVAARLTGTEVT